MDAISKPPAGGGARDSRPLHVCRSLVGNSLAIARVRRLIDQVAGTGTAVLITGETGTGKEVAARNIHYRSGRSHGPFVPVNCGAVPDELLESELFGHEKGAFTGATTSRKGRFELAHGGTLFLDEVGDMPPGMQVKLLRAVQEQVFERVGGTTPVRVDVRIIAATHRDLERSVLTGEFREDLYYRLNVFPVQMPALRQRAADIPLLLEELALRLRHEKGVHVRLTSAAVDALAAYDWPGNVRELANVLERLAILFPDQEIGLTELPRRYRSAADGAAAAPVSPLAPAPTAAATAADPMAELARGGMDLKRYLHEIERSLIEQALVHADGVVSRAARLLGLRRTTLVEKMRRMQPPIEVPRRTRG